jgi:arylsulfatase A-like enzyme
VSNAFRHEEEPDTVYPQRLHASLAPLRLNRSEAGAEMARLGIPDWKEQDASVPMHAAKDVLDAYRLYVAQDLTVDRVADQLYLKEPVQVFSAYFRLVDVTSHFAVHFVDRKVYDEAVALEKAGTLTPEARKRIDREFARALAPIYKLMDRTIQKYLDRRDDRTVLIVCSDHGFRFFRGNYAHAHKKMEPPDGVLFFHGPGVRKGHRIAGATIFDIAPTILHTMGQPVGADMDGRVLKSALDAGGAPVRSIASYETSGGARVADTPTVQHPEMDKDVLDDLKTLGYIGGKDKDDAPPPPSPSPR